MKTSKLRTVMLAAVILTALAAGAQTTTQPDRDGTVVVPDRPTAIDANVAPTTALRPVRPERPELPPPVKARIERFKLDARQYIAQQQALKQKLQGANDQQRALVRAQMQELRERWLERSREMRQEFKERLPEVKARLEDHRKMLDEIRENARQDIQDRQDGARRGVE